MNANETVTIRQMLKHQQPGEESSQLPLPKPSGHALIPLPASILFAGVKQACGSPRCEALKWLPRCSLFAEDEFLMAVNSTSLPAAVNRSMEKRGGLKGTGSTWLLTEDHSKRVKQLKQEKVWATNSPAWSESQTKHTVRSENRVPCFTFRGVWIASLRRHSH